MQMKQRKMQDKVFKTEAQITVVQKNTLNS